MKSKSMRFLIAMLASMCIACAVACGTTEGGQSDTSQNSSQQSVSMLPDSVSSDSSQDASTSSGSASSDSSQDSSTSSSSVSSDSSQDSSTSSGSASSDSSQDSSTPSIPVESISLNYTELRIEKGQQEELLATITPAEATNKEVIWTSADESVATVVDGVVVAIGCGETTITVKTVHGEKTATCAVMVYQSVLGVSLSASSIELNVGESQQLVASVSPIDATNKNVSWSVDNACVTVDETGLVVAVEPGEAIITVTTEDGGKEITCAVKVTQPVSGIELDITSGTLLVGGELNLTATMMTMLGIHVLNIQEQRFTMTINVFMTATGIRHGAIQDTVHSVLPSQQA